MPQDNIRRYLKHGTLPQLRVFEASVRLGSLARAAEELHMSAPTASVQMRKLSETIGAPLFEHVGTHVFPTEVGRRVFTSCGDIFAALASLEQALGEMRALASGTLRLTAASASRSFAPRLLGAFTALHPGIEVSLRVENHAALQERMQRNEDDLYLVVDLAARQGIVLQSILSNPLVVLARRDHRLAGARRIPFAALAAEPFLMREAGSGTREAALGVFARHGIAPKARMELASNEAVREAILAGAGISILARHTLGLDPESDEFACLDVEGFPIESQWQLAYRTGKHVSSAARAFLDFARAEARKLARGALHVPAPRGTL